MSGEDPHVSIKAQLQARQKDTQPRRPVRHTAVAPSSEAVERAIAHGDLNLARQLIDLIERHRDA